MNLVKKIFVIILTLSGGLMVSSCSSVKVDEYKDYKPAFDFENFFAGDLEAHGIFQDRSGKIAKQILCKMKAEKKGDSVVIDEDFVYSDGDKDHRQWIVKKNGEGKYVGTAGDVIGNAEIETSGFAFNMRYTLKLKVGRYFQMLWMRA